MPQQQTGYSHPEDAYVRSDGYRDLTIERHIRREGDIVHIGDPHQSGPIVARLDLTPEALDFLIDSLPQRDGWTEQLRYARRLAKGALWDLSR
jgi:hypothetical protein